MQAPAPEQPITGPANLELNFACGLQPLQQHQRPLKSKRFLKWRVPFLFEIDSGVSIVEVYSFICAPSVISRYSITSTLRFCCSCLNPMSFLFMTGATGSVFDLGAFTHFGHRCFSSSHLPPIDGYGIDQETQRWQCRGRIFFFFSSSQRHRRWRSSPGGVFFTRTTGIGLRVVA